MLAHPLFFSTYFILGILAVVCDVKTKKIPNIVNLLGLLLLYPTHHVYLASIEPVAVSFWFIICFMLWLFKLLGAGDSKFLMWLGVGIKTSEILSTLLGIFLVGISYIGISLLITGKWRSIIMNMRDILLLGTSGKNKIIFSPPLFLSMLVHQIFSWQKIFQL